MTKNALSPILSALVVTCLLPSDPAVAGAGDYWCGPTEIPGSSASKFLVKLHPDLILRHSDGSLWSTTEIEQEVKFALERYMDIAPSDMPPLEFGGWESSSTSFGDIPPAGVIAVRPGPSDCGARTQNFASSSNGARIEMWSEPVCTTRAADHWEGVVPNGTTFMGVLMHELSHAVGFDHMDTCNSPALSCSGNSTEIFAGCGLMDSHGWSSEWYEPEYADIDGLRSVYGDWGYDGRRRRETANTTSWSTLSAGPLSATPNVGSAWSQGSTLMPFAVHNSSGDPQLYRWQRSGDSLLNWGVPYPYGAQVGRIGAAVSYGYRYMLFTYGQYQTSTDKRLRWSWHTSATTNGWVASSQAMGRSGHMGAWDPRSNRLVHVWRNENQEIVLSHSSGTSDVVTPTVLSGNSYQAAATPSITCGPTSIYYNCLMVWPSMATGGEHYHFLHWYQFRINGSGASASFQFAPSSYSNGYYQYGPADVSYTGVVDSTSTFMIAFKNPGRCYYTLKKGQYSYHSFGNEVGHCAPPGAHVGPPLIGNTSNTYTEAWSFYNGE